MVYEDFAKDPAAAYRGVLEFLGVDDLGPALVRAAQPRAPVAQPLPRRVAQRAAAAPPAGAATGRARPIRRRLWHQGVKSALHRANTEPMASPAVTDRVRTRLRREYADDVRRTAELIGRPDIVRRWGFDDVPNEAAPVERTPAAVGN